MRLPRWAYHTVVGELGLLLGAALPVMVAVWAHGRLSHWWSVSQDERPFWPAALAVGADLVLGALALVLAGKLVWRTLRPTDTAWRDGLRAGWSTWRWLRFLGLLCGGTAIYQQNYQIPSSPDVYPAVLFLLSAVAPLLAALHDRDAAVRQAAARGAPHLGRPGVGCPVRCRRQRRRAGARGGGECLVV